VLALVLATALPTLAAAAEDWNGLKADYTQLRKYMSSKRRIGPAERTALEGLLGRLDGFIAANPDDRRALAMDISVSTWLGRTDRVERDYEMLAQLTDADAVWLAWAKMRLAENRYDDAGSMARSRPYDLAETPEIAIIDARARMSRNEFQAAIDAIDAIPEAGLSKPGIRANANRIRKESERWLTLWEAEAAARNAEDAAGTAPVIQLITSRGPVTIMLFEEQAPNTVANFIELSEQGFYNGTRFHRVEPNFVVQGGDPNSRPGTPGEPGTGGRGAKIPDESSRDDKRLHFAGAVAMAKAPNPNLPGASIPNTSSSQFYVVLEPRESLNKEYTVFGRVIDGMEVLQRIRRDDELTAVATISRPEREYKATTMLPPSVPPAGTTIELP
jgi:peptidyl-prolyl cis-trans isomerase B (cyclophilin B)